MPPVACKVSVVVGLRSVTAGFQTAWLFPYKQQRPAGFRPTMADALFRVAR